ncbi:MAG: hypothetical protein IJY92_05865 [Alphaproteobacteria bacterium]|nr:hypothetical protein [Alphaproteobacteria bacterium]
MKRLCESRVLFIFIPVFNQMDNKYQMENNRCSGCLNAGINEPSRAI